MLRKIILILILPLVIGADESTTIWVDEIRLNQWLKEKKIDAINNYLEAKIYSEPALSAYMYYQYNFSDGKTYQWYTDDFNRSFKEEVPDILDYPGIQKDYDPQNPPIVFYKPLAAHVKYKRRPGIPKGKYIPNICEVQLDEKGRCPADHQLEFFYNYKDKTAWSHFLKTGRYPLPGEKKKESKDKK